MEKSDGLPRRSDGQPCPPLQKLQGSVPDGPLVLQNCVGAMVQVVHVSPAELTEITRFLEEKVTPCGGPPLPEGSVPDVAQGPQTDIGPQARLYSGQGASPVEPEPTFWAKARGPIVGMLLLVAAGTAGIGHVATLGHYCHPHHGTNHGVHHATHSPKGRRRSEPDGPVGGTGNADDDAKSDDGNAAAGGDGLDCIHVQRVDWCEFRIDDCFCWQRQRRCLWWDGAYEGTARGDSRPTIEDATRDGIRITHVIGRLEYRPDFSEVWVDNVHYDLRAYGKARLFVEFMVANQAFDVSSAKHLADEIAPYVWANGNYPPSAEIRVQDFFKDRSGDLARLRRELVVAAGDKGKYYLKTGAV